VGNLIVRLQLVCLVIDPTHPPTDIDRFCFDQFMVGLWSSASKYNIRATLDAVFGEVRRYENASQGAMDEKHEHNRPMMLVVTLWRLGCA